MTGLEWIQALANPQADKAGEEAAMVTGGDTRYLMAWKISVCFCSKDYGVCAASRLLKSKQGTTVQELNVYCCTKVNKVLKRINIWAPQQYFGEMYHRG